jgi:hypothetical protein
MFPWSKCDSGIWTNRQDRPVVSFCVVCQIAQPTFLKKCTQIISTPGELKHICEIISIYIKM